MDIVFQKVEQLVNKEGTVLPQDFKDTVAKSDLFGYLLPYRYVIYLENYVILFSDEKFLKMGYEDLQKQFCIGEYEGYSVSRVMEKHGWKTIGHTLIIQCGFNSLEHVDTVLSQ